ncbi:PEP-CTERM sorting domain-containing protein [Tumidithrix helvetica PCC 7403]|uniref:NF038130 family PEP-CTERM protein n=1 Tax=Tumidithrix helvetica TaxID=3457545 RepID=UPI003CBE1999
MTKSTLSFLTSVSVLAGISAIVSTAPAFAVGITGASIGGSAPSDYLVFDANATNTFLVPNTPANVQKVLDGDAGSPTGNVELAASSEQPGFDFTKNTSLSGTIGGQVIQLSSLTLSDWEAVVTPGGFTFGQKWFLQALLANSITPSTLGLTPLAYTAFIGLAYQGFVATGGFQRFSDPNISYVNQDSGLVKIGLAGYFNAKDVIVTPDNINYIIQQLISQGFTKPAATLFVNSLIAKLPPTIQASEVVKVTYAGRTDFLYSFQATKSGLISNDGTRSHTGNYEVTLRAKPIPVPGSATGAIAAGVLGAGYLMRHKLKKHRQFSLSNSVQA